MLVGLAVIATVADAFYGIWGILQETTVDMHGYGTAESNLASAWRRCFDLW